MMTEDEAFEQYKRTKQRIQEKYKDNKHPFIAAMLDDDHTVAIVAASVVASFILYVYEDLKGRTFIPRLYRDEYALAKERLEKAQTQATEAARPAIIVIWKEVQKQIGHTK